MSLLQYLKKHIIVSIGSLETDKCVIVEVIVDNPEELLEQVIKNDCYISEIRWWDRTPIFTQSKIGYGGTPDPRDPQNYYFAETDLCNSFGKTTSIPEYVKYLEDIKKQNFMYDLYPAFDIYKK